MQLFFNDGKPSQYKYTEQLYNAINNNETIATLMGEQPQQQMALQQFQPQQQQQQQTPFQQPQQQMLQPQQQQFVQPPQQMQQMPQQPSIGNDNLLIDGYPKTEIINKLNKVTNSNIPNFNYYKLMNLKEKLSQNKNITPSEKGYLLQFVSNFNGGKHLKKHKKTKVKRQSKRKRRFSKRKAFRSKKA